MKTQINKTKFLFLFVTSFFILCSSVHAGLGIREGNLKIRGRLWPNATIPYVIEDGFTVEARQVILSSVREYSQKTVVTFIPRQNEEHYLVFRAWNNKSAGTGIGMQLGPQILHAHFNVNKITIMHELGHTVGLYHEHNRPDVESYLGYKEKQDGSMTHCKKQFFKIKNYDAIKLGKFDYLSVMNYYNGCNISFKPTVYRKQAKHRVNYYNRLYFYGDRKGFKMGENLSQGDIASIRELYDNSSHSISKNWNYDSCEDTPASPTQCYHMKKNNYCTAYHVQEGTYRYCAATCGLCKQGNSDNPVNDPSDGNGNSNDDQNDENDSGKEDNDNEESSKKDVKPKYCPIWVGMGMCQTHVFVQRNCEKSCEDYFKSKDY